MKHLFEEFGGVIISGAVVLILSLIFVTIYPQIGQSAVEYINENNPIINVSGNEDIQEKIKKGQQLRIVAQSRFLALHSSFLYKDYIKIYQPIFNQKGEKVKEKDITNHVMNGEKMIDTVKIEHIQYWESEKSEPKKVTFVDTSKAGEYIVLYRVEFEKTVSYCRALYVVE